MSVFDTETGFFYAGTYLGRKKILAAAAAFDAQKDFHGYAADAFCRCSSSDRNAHSCTSVFITAI